MNVFEKFPQFIDTDVRTNRPMGYTVSADLMTQRHAALLSKDLVQGRSILDIGCCVGATGAWVLEAGAASYTGIELQHTLSQLAKSNLKQCYPDHSWSVIETSYEDFFRDNADKYDIIYAGGVIYAGLEYQKFLKECVDRSNHAVVIESGNPVFIINANAEQNLEFYPVTVYSEDSFMNHESGGNMLKITCAQPSAGAVRMLLEKYGCKFDQHSYDAVKRITDTEYQLRRWGAVFYKHTPEAVRTAEYLYKNPQETKVQPWLEAIPNQWEFNGDVARTFIKHARKHIPDYDKVINLSVTLCRPLSKYSKIIDIGCATGETVRRLCHSGFKNVLGVDNSEAMLAQCDADLGTYVKSDVFPAQHGPFAAVLCNWTMHFMKNKLQYLEDIYQNLEPGGFLVLSEKTVNSGVELDLYHAFKISQGVPYLEVKAKAASLVNSMFIDDVEWYWKSLRQVGFDRVSIVNAAPCFTTFLAYKRKEN
jgi:2-polyprenyl-3-methyl-5-hydroxy-6-metoxy-1,4-benzoquinol methylase